MEQPPPQQPPDHDPYEPPPSQSAGARRKTLGLVLAVAGVLVVLLGGGAVAAYLAGGFGGDGGDAPAEPVRAVEEFFDAAQRGDCARLHELLIEEVWNEGGELTREESIAECEESFAFEEENMPRLADAELVSRDGDRAVVAVTVDSPNEDNQISEITLVSENGDWKIEDLR